MKVWIIPWGYILWKHGIKGNIYYKNHMADNLYDLIWFDFIITYFIYTTLQCNMPKQKANKCRTIKIYLLSREEWTSSGHQEMDLVLANNEIQQLNRSPTASLQCLT